MMDSTISLLDTTTTSNGEMATIMSHKRKGDVIFTENSANCQSQCRSSGSDKREMTNKERIDALKRRLKTLRNHYFVEATGTDTFLESLKEIGADDIAPIDSMIQQSKNILADLDSKIQQAQIFCEQESSVLSELSMNLSLLEQNRDKLLMDMDNIDHRQLELQALIALHQREASEEIERMDRVDEERKREVPRLKHAISLYASTTGIKWDFSQDEILSGSVAVPDRQGLKLFATDPRDYDPVETSYRLWSLIEGSL